ncbi:MAG TPA: calcium-binding protein [Nocardioides sp.]|nr:calcium-binding protein [Nocardioides sp.]
MSNKSAVRAGLIAVVLVGTAAQPAAAGGSHSVLWGGCPGKRSATIVGTDGDDAIVGTPGRDVILAGAGDDVVRGRGGKDIICLGSGNDRAYGGRGQDVLQAGAGDDALDGGAGFDLVVAGDGADHITGTGGYGFVDGGAGSDLVELVADRGTYVNAGADDDTVVLHAGTLDAGVSLFGGPGTDSVDVTLPAAVGAARLSQRGSSTLVLGYRGGLDGWESLSLGGDVDWTYLGDDAGEGLSVTGGTLTAFLYGGDDHVTFAGDGDAYVNLGVGDVQSATTAGGDDVLLGGDGADQLHGGAGDDILDGRGSLADELYGDDGSDIGRDADGAAVCDSLEMGTCVVPTP